MTKFLIGARRAGLALFAAVVIAGSAQAQTRTGAGSTVSNTFTLNYSTGGFSQPQINNTSSPTTFTVDRLVDLTVTALDPSVNAAPNSTGNVVRYRVTNLSNDNIAYDFAMSNGSTTYTPTSVALTYFIDLDNDGVQDAGETLRTYTAGSASVDIAADANVVVIMSSSVPSGTADASFANVVLTADSLFPVTSIDPTCTVGTCPAGTQIVGDSNGNSLNGAAENVLLDGAGVSDSANAGNYSANALITVVAPTLAATKSVTVFASAPGSDAACAALTSASSGNQYSVPGACVQYVISITNTGSGQATALNIADRLPAQVRFIKAELGTSTSTGFADDGGVAGSGPSLAAPSAAEDCNGTSNCLANLTDAILASGQNGQIRIWARIR